jgi:hypothetical protein
LEQDYQYSQEKVPEPLQKANILTKIFKETEKRRFLQEMTSFFLEKLFLPNRHRPCSDHFSYL